MLGTGIHRPGLWKDPTGKEFIVAPVADWLKLAQVDPMLPDKGLDQKTGQFRGQKCACHPGNPGGRQRLQQKAAPYASVQTPEHPFLLLSVLEGYGVVEGRSVKKGDHMLVPNGYGTISFLGDMELIVSTAKDK